MSLKIKRKLTDYWPKKKIGSKTNVHNANGYHGTDFAQNQFAKHVFIIEYTLHHIATNMFIIITPHCYEQSGSSHVNHGNFF
jgi:hypothetical protein